MVHYCQIKKDRQYKIPTCSIDSLSILIKRNQPLHLFAKITPGKRFYCIFVINIIFLVTDSLSFVLSTLFSVCSYKLCFLSFRKERVLVSHSLFCALFGSRHRTLSGRNDQSNHKYAGRMCRANLRGSTIVNSPVLPTVYLKHSYLCEKVSLLYNWFICLNNVHSAEKTRSIQRSFVKSAQRRYVQITRWSCLKMGQGRSLLRRCWSCPGRKMKSPVTMKKSQKICPRMESSLI